ncbi:unnamed protein product [Notodromas monacha]|uniref:Uncharacterized protein n=1 Tax=Notodromas monacha TaxID=399045 RepID=A0A7R9BTJ0_9CRUS|nr:unnamed protein product [Notodromas monacha]CAG0920092.1 unnamed protein product [Notodromas monacha]
MCIADSKFHFFLRSMNVEFSQKCARSAVKSAGSQQRRRGSDTERRVGSMRVRHNAAPGGSAVPTASGTTSALAAASADATKNSCSSPQLSVGGPAPPPPLPLVPMLDSGRRGSAAKEVVASWRLKK